MALGTEALSKPTPLVAGLLSGRLWKNVRFRKKGMLETHGVFTLGDDLELFDSAQGDAGEREPAQVYKARQ